MNSKTNYRLLRFDTESNKIIEIDRYAYTTWEEVIVDFVNSKIAHNLRDNKMTLSEWQDHVIQNPIKAVQKINQTQYGKYRYIFTRDSELLDFLFELGQFDPYCFV